MKNIIKINLIILIICIIIPKIDFAADITGPKDPIKYYSQIENSEADDIESTEGNSIGSLNSQKDNLENKIIEKENQVQYIEEDLSATLVELETLSQEISDKQAEVQLLELQEIELNKYINDTESKLSDLKEKYNLQDEALKTRLFTMYKFGKVKYLDVLLHSRNLSEFLSNYYYIEMIAQTDTNLLKAVEEKRDEIQKLMNELEDHKKQISSSREEKEKIQIALSNMKIIKDKKVTELNEKELELHDELEIYRAQVQQVENEIKKLALLSVNSNYVGGTMSWPVPGYTRVSSAFGMRTHPITGVYKLHTGMDIAAPMGASFVASNEGIVVKAEMNGAYGNMVMVDHGGGVSTLYAHGSQILVKVGQTVKKGDEVLKVGSTGYSTGPHAHFEIRINGQYVNPIDYLTSNSSNMESETVDLTKNQ